MAEIKNPNQQGGGQDPRSILTFSLVFLVLFLGFQFLKQQHKLKDAAGPVQNSQAQHAPAPTSEVAPQGQGPAGTGSSPGSKLAAAGKGASANASANPAATPAIQASSEQESVIENELYKIRFSNKGAQVVSWVLKRFEDDHGQPLDLVQPTTAKLGGFPLSIYTYDAGLRAQLANAMYVPSATGPMLAPTELSFDYSAGGLTVKKTFRFDASYVLHAEVAVTQNGAPVEALLAWPAGLGDQVTSPLFQQGQMDWMQDGKTTHQAAKKVVGAATVNGPFDWAGTSDSYFAAVFLPDSPASANLVTLHAETDAPHSSRDPNKMDKAPFLGAAVGDTSGVTRVRLYAGPKSLDVLKTVKATAADGKASGESLEPLVDFGFWGILSKPLFLALHWIYDHVVQNWGWAILLLTLVINVALLPLRVTSMKSALKMQRIQPQMQAIREKFKKYKMGDPRQAEMNREIMALQKREGVNMFGGCLPMLVQFPLLIAFYTMLQRAMDLRHAHWLWLPDLSAPDPLHILPLFFIGTMFLTQWMTPSPGMDPAQRKMMAFTMPAMMGFFFWNVAAGLSLYYAFGNVISIITQMVMNRSPLGLELRAMVAKRARKQQGKTITAKR